MKQFRISVNGRFQFAVTTDESPDVLAQRAAAVMNLGDVQVFVAPGQINLVTK